jgi:beta-glucosidase
MTLEEKIAQLQCVMAIGDPVKTAEQFPHGIGEIVAFPMAQDPFGIAQGNLALVEAFSKNRLGIPPILHIEALSGAMTTGGTIFPVPMGLGATFNPDTICEMAGTIREQMLSTGYRQALSPVLDIARDPRWGRIGETYGEDPALCAAIGAAYVKGLQGENLTDGAIATAKHFLGYGVSDGGLNMATNPITERDLRENYAKPFQAAITESGMQGIMNSYGTIDGEMIIGSQKILTGLLRDEMKFEGIVVSDYTSLDRLVNYRLSENIASAGISALEAGLDVECPLPRGYGESLAKAVKDGILDEKFIDRSAKRVLESKFKLGLFDDPNPRLADLASAYGDPKHQARSLKAARESIVLLKNENVLPFSKDVKKIAVIGPHGDSIRLLFGGYTVPAGIEMQMSASMASDMAGLDGLDSMLPPPGEQETYPGSSVLKEKPEVTELLNMAFGPFVPTILKAIKEKAPNAEVIYAKGADIAGNDKSGFAEAIEAAKNADSVILAIGGKHGWGANCTIGEGLDSDSIGLTGVQEELAKAVIEANSNTAVLHMDARPLSSVYLKENCKAIIECWFPGGTGGASIADVLFGDYNPAGRLPATVARNAGQIPVYSGQKTGNSYYSDTVAGALSKYVDSDKKPLFFFGEGLSYTAFEYKDLSVTPQTPADGTVEISFTISNTGAVEGEETAQVYVIDELASVLRPAKELAGWARVPVKPGESTNLSLVIRADQFAFLNQEMNWLVEKGTMKVLVGSSSEDIRLEGSFEITDTRIIDGAKRGFYAKQIAKRGS